jgi:hypothetical protein
MLRDSQAHPGALRRQPGVDRWDALPAAALTRAARAAEVFVADVRRGSTAQALHDHRRGRQALAERQSQWAVVSEALDRIWSSRTPLAPTMPVPTR